MPKKIIPDKKKLEVNPNTGEAFAKRYLSPVVANNSVFVGGD